MVLKEKIRNIAIIAHVDHGKTTLVDAMLKFCGAYRENEQIQDRAMDSGDLEKERGITILSKNAAVFYGDYKINIVDTPGHADFGSEVERILKMVDGVLLLIDAFEGCMPQTRFVLKKALGLGLMPIVIINKMDRHNARAEEVVNEIIDLFIDLGANDLQLEFPIIYASARRGLASIDPDDDGVDLSPMFETIINTIPVPSGDINEPLQFFISNIEYDEYIGRIGIGRVERGSLKTGQQVLLCKKDDTTQTAKINKMFQFESMKRVEAQYAGVGDIIAIAGIADIQIGETICDVGYPEPLPFIVIDEPTIRMTFCVNNSPFAGREGSYVTSRHLRERLFRELENNVGLKIEETESPDSFDVSGRGELHLSILIENMRRQGLGGWDRSAFNCNSNIICL